MGNSRPVGLEESDGPAIRSLGGNDYRGIRQSYKKRDMAEPSRTGRGVDFLVRGTGAGPFSDALTHPGLGNSGLLGSLVITVAFGE